MPVIRGSLQAEGALVDVIIGWSQSGARGLRAALRPVPPPVTARALLDTGAEVSCVDGGLIRQLALPFGGMVGVNLPSHGAMGYGFLHDASLIIAHPSGNSRKNLTIHDLTVLEVPLAPLGYEVLIGREILAKIRFVYNGPANSYTLAN